MYLDTSLDDRWTRAGRGGGVNAGAGGGGGGEAAYAAQCGIPDSEICGLLM